MDNMNNKLFRGTILYIIILLLAVLSAYQYSVIRKYHGMIYNHNIEAYNQVELEINRLWNRLTNPDIANKDKAGFKITQSEKTDIYNQLYETYGRIRTNSNSVNPINKKSKDIKLILSKIELSLSDLPEQFRSAEDITYLDVYKLVEELNTIENAIRTGSSLGYKPDIILSDEKKKSIIDSIDEFAKYNVKNQ